MESGVFCGESEQAQTARGNAPWNVEMGLVEDMLKQIKLSHYGVLVDLDMI